MTEYPSQMNDCFVRIKKAGWIWNIKKSIPADSLIAKIQDSKNKILVKSNANRDVFRIETKGQAYYVKHYRSSGRTGRFLNFVFPKCKAEYVSSELLSDSGIRTARVAGWGVKGNESMLITEELAGYVDTKKFWFSEANRDILLKRAFLKKLKEFVAKTISSKIFHPDFHLGNILVRPETLELAIIDTHGIKRTEKYNKAKLIKMLAIFGAMRGELPDAEAEKIIEELFSLLNLPDLKLNPEAVWKEILLSESAETEKLWSKRKKQILSENPKYAVKMRIGGSVWMIRRSLSGLEHLGRAEMEEILMAHKDRIKELSKPEAEELKLKSFHLEFHRINHIMPLAWSHGNNNESIIFQNIPENPETATGELLDEFLTRCRIAGFKVKDQNACLLSQNRIFCPIENIY